MNAREERKIFKETQKIAEELLDYLFNSEGWMNIPDMTLEELAYKMAVFDDVYAWNPEKLDLLVKDSKMRWRFICDFVEPDREGAVDWSEVVKLPDDYDEYHAMVTEIGNRIAERSDAATSKGERTIEVVATYSSSTTPYIDYKKRMGIGS